MSNVFHKTSLCLQKSLFLEIWSVLTESILFKMVFENEKRILFAFLRSSQNTGFKGPFEGSSTAFPSLEGMVLKLKLQYFDHLMQSWLIGKDSDAGRDWGQEEKGTTEDEMAGWHHWLDGRESEWIPGVGWWTGRPGVLWFMGSQSRTRLSDWTELNWTAPKQSLCWCLHLESIYFRILYKWNHMYVLCIRLLLYISAIHSCCLM